MPNVLDLLFRRQSSKPPVKVDWDAVAKVLEARTALLEETDLFMIAFCPKKHPALGSECPGMVIGRMPSVLFPDDENCYQVSFMGPTHEHLSEEQVFTAWVAIGFQAFRNKGELSYGRGLMSITEAAGAIRDALRVISEAYGDEQVCYLESLGDPLLRRMLEGSSGFGGTSEFRFKAPFTQ